MFTVIKSGYSSNCIKKEHYYSVKIEISDKNKKVPQKQDILSNFWI